MKTILTILVVIIALASNALSAEKFQEQIVFAGAGSNLPITRLLATEFMKSHPGVSIEVPDSIGSAGGIKAVSEGAVTVGLAAREANSGEKKSGLTFLPYARTIIVMGAHPSVKDDNISFDDLNRIYRGEKNRWTDGKNIIVLTRDDKESSIEVMYRVIPGFNEVHADSLKARRWSTAFTDQDMNRMIVSTPFALGITDSGAVRTEQLKIKILRVNGIEPLAANVINGKYPLVKTLYFVFRKDNLNENAKAFMEFTRSDRGQKILKRNGYMTGE